MATSPGLLRKDFAVFDCDAHVDDPPRIWRDYVEPRYRDLVRQTYWVDERHAVLNGRTAVLGHFRTTFKGFPYNPTSLGGPGMTRKAARRLQQMELTPEQKDYLDHKGAYDAAERVKDMDLMGIDQVLIIPTMVLAHLPHAENVDGAHAVCRAYNNWVADECLTAPERIFGAGLLPFQDPYHTVVELRRIAKKKFPVGLVRAIDAQGGYPNRIFPSRLRVGESPMTMDAVFRTFEETGVVMGLHTLGPAATVHSGAAQFSPGELITRASESSASLVDGQTVGFMFEGMTWLTQVLMSGFLDRYPKLKMAVYEANSTWLPLLLEQCDRLFELYANERAQPAQRLPSEAFRQQCVIAFESDETPVFRQWDRFENIGVWSSDAYHHDGADAWSAIGRMEKAAVPREVQAKLMGGNAQRLYGIEPKLVVTEEKAIVRPAWFPQGEALAQWWEREANPRKYPRAQAPSSPAASARPR